MWAQAQAQSQTLPAFKFGRRCSVLNTRTINLELHYAYEMNAACIKFRKVLKWSPTKNRIRNPNRNAP